MTISAISPVTHTVPIRTYPLFPSKRCKKIGQAKPTEQNFTRFYPSEFKLGENRVTQSDLYSRSIFLARNPQITEETTKGDKGKWLNELISGKITHIEALEIIKSYGFSDEEAKELLTEAIYHSERASNWAVDNENYGEIASNSMFLAASIGVVQTILKEPSHSNVFSLRR